MANQLKKKINSAEILKGYENIFPFNRPLRENLTRPFTAPTPIEEKEEEEIQSPFSFYTQKHTHLNPDSSGFYKDEGGKSQFTIPELKQKHISSSPIEQNSLSKIQPLDTTSIQKNEENYNSYITKSSFQDQFMKQWKGWILEDIYFCMNRLTITSLVIGLMVLGILFFSVGFMASVYFSASKNSTSSNEAFEKKLTWSHLSMNPASGESSLSGVSSQLNQSTLDANYVIPRILQPFATVPDVRIQRPYDNSQTDHDESDVPVSQEWVAPNMRSARDNAQLRYAENNFQAGLNRREKGKNFEQMGYTKLQKEDNISPPLYCLHISVFESEAAARKQMNNLFIQGYSAYIAKVDRPVNVDQPSSLYLLRIGNFDNLHKAQQVANHFQNAFGQSPVIVSLKTQP